MGYHEIKKSTPRPGIHQMPPSRTQLCTQVAYDPVRSHTFPLMRGKRTGFSLSTSTSTAIPIVTNYPDSLKHPERYAALCSWQVNFIV